MPQHRVTREQGVLLEQQEADVVVRVAGRVKRTQGRARNSKHLSVGDGQLAGGGRVFAEDCGGAEGEEVWDAADVVVVVVCEEGGRDGGGFRGEDGAERGAPRGKALRRVDQETGAARAEEVGVCTLEGELAGVSTTAVANVPAPGGGETFPGLPPRIRITAGESRSTAGKGGSPANCALRNSSWAAYFWDIVLKSLAVCLGIIGKQGLDNCGIISTFILTAQPPRGRGNFCRVIPHHSHHCLISHWQ